MDAFEEVVAALLVRKGYWVQTSVKVDLTKDDKHKIGRPASPRWELDVVGYSGAKNELLVMECKSYLDSTGVCHKDLMPPATPNSDRYKLFVEPILRETVLGRLATQFEDAGFCRPNPTLILGMAAGKIRMAAVEGHFIDNEWTLWTPDKIKAEFIALAKSGYENSVASIVAKLLLR